MKDFDFSELSVQELQQINEKINKEIQSKRTVEKREKMNKIMECIKDYVDTYNDLMIEYEYDDNRVWIRQEDTWEILPSDDMIIIR